MLSLSRRIFELYCYGLNIEKEYQDKLFVFNLQANLFCFTEMMRKENMGETINQMVRNILFSIGDSLPNVNSLLLIGDNYLKLQKLFDVLALQKNNINRYLKTALFRFGRGVSMWVFPRNAVVFLQDRWKIRCYLFWDVGYLWIYDSHGACNQESTPTPTFDDFRFDSGWEEKIRSNLTLLLRDWKPWKLQWEHFLAELAAQRLGLLEMP